MIYDSIKQWFLRVIAEEEKQPAPIGSAQDNSNTPQAPNACPQCGSNLFVEITGTVRRCAQCGFQGRPRPKPASVPPAIVKRTAAPTACLSCGSALLQEVGGGGWRCQACGAQTGIEGGNGISRSELETFSGGDMKMNPPNFFMALARLRGR